MVDVFGCKLQSNNFLSYAKNLNRKRREGRNSIHDTSLEFGYVSLFGIFRVGHLTHGKVSARKC